MLGKSVLWQPGTDHAGIATQLVVENRLKGLGKNIKDLSRDQFIDEVWKWKEISGNTIINQTKRLGSSADWSRNRFTMDDDLSENVRDIFIDLYDNEHELLEQVTLNKHESIILFEGGHGLTMEEDCHFLEVKQGPYDQENDKYHF